MPLYKTEETAPKWDVCIHLMEMRAQCALFCCLIGTVLFAGFNVGAAALGGPPKCNISPGFGPPRGAAPTADLRIKCALGYSLPLKEIASYRKIVYNRQNVLLCERILKRP